MIIIKNIIVSIIEKQIKKTIVLIAS